VTKPNPENCKNCSPKYTTSVHNPTQNSSDNLPSYLQINIIAQTLSIRGKDDTKFSNTDPTVASSSSQQQAGLDTSPLLKQAALDTRLQRLTAVEVMWHYQCYAAVTGVMLSVARNPAAYV